MRGFLLARSTHSSPRRQALMGCRAWRLVEVETIRGSKEQLAHSLKKVSLLSLLASCRDSVKFQFTSQLMPWLVGCLLDVTIIHDIYLVNIKISQNGTIHIS